MSPSKNEATQHKIPFFDKQKLHLHLDLKDISLDTSEDQRILDVSLFFLLNHDTFFEIFDKNLFNSKFVNFSTDLRIDFQQNEALQLEVGLKPSLFYLLEPLNSCEQIFNHLIFLGRDNPSHLLLFTESWLLLSIELQGSDGVTSRTVWSMLSPNALAQAAQTGSNEEIAETITDFFKTWTESQLSEVAQQTTAKALGGFSRFFEELTDGFVDTLAKAATVDNSILETAIEFLEKENWAYARIPEKSALRLAYRGKSGQWNCYLQADETKRTLVFYSIGPITALPHLIAEIAEFIIRANYGMVIGNFELDYSDGEIRYKTSIDVEGDRLTHVLIKQLVYTNVMTMDQYLPGILAVIEQGVEPVAAIEQIEGEG